MQSIVAEKRDILGKKTNSLRKRGFLPAVIYGKGKPSESIAVKEIDFLKLWKSAGESSIVELELDGKKRNVLIQDVAIDPLKDTPIHADFYAVDMTKTVKVEVPLEFMGESDAVKSGGILVKVLHAIEVESLPADLPRALHVDLSILKNAGDSFAVKDLKVSKSVKILKNPDEIIALVEAPRAEEALKGEEATAPSLESIEVLSKKPKAEGEEAAETSTATSSKNE